MNNVELGFLIWAIIASFIAVFEFLLILKSLDDDSDAIQVKNKRIAELNKKLTKIESQNLELESQIRELKEKANKQLVRTKIRKKGRMTAMIDFNKIVDGIEMIEFFNQRAGRELWFDKLKEIQEEDLKKENEILNAAKKALLICSYVGEEELAAAERRLKDAQREYDIKNMVFYDRDTNEEIFSLASHL
jgi:cell division protein FtsB